MPLKTNLTNQESRITQNTNGLFEVSKIADCASLSPQTIGLYGPLLQQSSTKPKSDITYPISQRRSRNVKHVGTTGFNSNVIQNITSIPATQ
jgi:hypothetical protein